MVNLPQARESLAIPTASIQYIWKHYMKALRINSENWEDITAERSRWHRVLLVQLMLGEDKILVRSEEEISPIHDTSTIIESTDDDLLLYEENKISHRTILWGRR